MRNQTIDNLDVLAQFHPEPPSSITETTQIRSQARLQQIMAMPRGISPMVSTLRAIFRAAAQPTGGNPLGRDPVAAAAIVATSVMLPQNAGVIAPAGATTRGWTAIPSEVPSDILASGDAACQTAINTVPEENRLRSEGVPPEQLTVRQRHAPTGLVDTLAASEQRGDWAWLAYRTDRDALASCLIWLADPAGPSVQSLDFHKPGSGSGFMVGDQIRWSTMAGGRVGPQYSWQLPNGELLSGTMIHVGPDVKSVVLHSEVAGDVAATMGDGFFMAWWPGPIDPDGFGSPDWVPGGPIPRTGWTGRSPMAAGYTATLTDGSTRLIPLFASGLPSCDTGLGDPLCRN